MSSELAQKFLNEDYWDEEYPDEDYDNLDLPVPDWHLAILEERMARYKSEPVEWIPWEEVEKELMQEILDAMERRKK